MRTVSDYAINRLRISVAQKGVLPRPYTAQKEVTSGVVIHGFSSIDISAIHDKPDGGKRYISQSRYWKWKALQDWN
jgi:hypothetical protein